MLPRRASHEIIACFFITHMPDTASLRYHYDTIDIFLPIFHTRCYMLSFDASVVRHYCLRVNDVIAADTGFTRCKTQPILLDVLRYER